jgi:hypothetical protein
VPRPTWLAYSFGVVMVAVSLYCVAWLVVARRRNHQKHVDVNVAHVAMGLAMAGMLVPRLNVVPDGLWEVVFVAMAVWFGWHAARVVAHHIGAHLDVSRRHSLSHNLIHLAMGLAMVYMYLGAVPASAATGSAMSMTGPTGAAANFVGLPLLFVAILFASAVWQLDGLSRYAPVRGAMVGALATGTVPAPPGPRPPDPADPSLGEAPRPLESDPAPGQGLAPRLEMGCHIVMCITMGYMLTLML